MSPSPPIVLAFAASDPTGGAGLQADIRVDAFKLGVLGSARNIAAIARVLAEHPDIPVVCDPVLASGRGDALASGEMLDALREMILPQSTVLTPNSLEAR